MTVQQLIDLAKSAELKQLSVAKSDAVDEIIGFINLGLIELYKRFPIDVAEMVISLGVDGTETNPYTMINEEYYEMPENFMWLVAAYGEVADSNIEGTVNILPINEEDNPLSINTVNWKTIQVPVWETGSHISLIYVKSPVYLTEDDLSEELPIPPQMVEALLHYIGYRGHGAVNGEINAENNTHYQRFEASCDRIYSLGLFTGDGVHMNTRVVNKGFV